MELKKIPHQLEALEIAKKHRRFLFADPTGAGKTIEQLMIISHFNDRPWLVILPFGVIESWLDKVVKFFNELKAFSVASYNKKPYYQELCKNWELPKYRTIKEMKDWLSEACNVMLVNPEQLRGGKYDGFFSGKGKLPWNLIVDESDLMGNTKSKITKFILKEFKRAERTYLFSATPADTVFQLYPQVTLIDPTIFPYSFFRFQQKYGKVNVAATRKIKSHGGWMTVYDPVEEAWDEIKEKTKHCIRWLDKAEIMPYLPPLREEFYNIECPRGLPKSYRWDLSRAKKAYQENPEGFLENVMSFREVASGFLYFSDEIWNAEKKKFEKKRNDEKTEHFTHYKIKALEHFSHKYKDEKIIIWINFIEEAQQILQHFKRSSVALCCRHPWSAGNNKELVFFKNHARFLVAHPATIGRGVDGLQDFCSTQICYSPVYEARVFAQMRDRLHRHGQEKPVTMIKFKTMGTIEESVWKALEKKQKFTDFLKEK